MPEKLIARRVPRYSSDTKGQYHRYTNAEGTYFSRDCEPSYKLSLETLNGEPYKIAAIDGEEIQLPIRLLCGNCFSVRNLKIVVKAE